MWLLTNTSSLLRDTSIWAQLSHYMLRYVVAGLHIYSKTLSNGWIDTMYMVCERTFCQMFLTYIHPLKGVHRFWNAIHVGYANPPPHGWCFQHKKWSPFSHSPCEYQMSILKLHFEKEKHTYICHCHDNTVLDKFSTIGAS